MDDDNSKTENKGSIHQGLTASPYGEDNPAARAVAFANTYDYQEEKVTPQPKGVDLKPTMTQDNKDLAAAGYQHLDEKHKPGNVKDELENVDIHEHQLSLDGLAHLHDTHFDVKDPAQSVGLTSEEAALRCVRDGKNILTPPKKRSALRKVRLISISPLGSY